MQKVQRHCQEAESCDEDADLDLQNRKKIRLPDTVPQAVSPDSMTNGEGTRNSKTHGREESSPSPPRRWWFSRHSPTTPCGETTTTPATESPLQVRNGSGMILSEHLGVTSDVVESLTHDVKNWSLTRLSPAALSTRSSMVGGDSSHTESQRKKEKQKRCKEAQRQVRMARRQCLEAQRRLFASSSHATTVD